MNQVQIYTILQSHGFNEGDAKSFITALQENQDVTTKTDLKDLELRMLKEFQLIQKEFQNIQVQISGVLKEVNAQIWKFFTGLAILATVFKLLSFWGK